MDDEPESPNEGAHEGVLKIYDELESPNEGACFRCMMNRNRHKKGLFFGPESPNEGACSRYMMNRNRQMRGVV